MHVNFHSQKKDLSQPQSPDFRHHQAYIETEERRVPHNQILGVSFEHFCYNSVQRSDSETRKIIHMNSSCDFLTMKAVKGSEQLYFLGVSPCAARSGSMVEGRNLAFSDGFPCGFHPEILVVMSGRSDSVSWHKGGRHEVGRTEVLRAPFESSSGCWRSGSSEWEKGSFRKPVLSTGRAWMGVVMLRGSLKMF